MSIAYMQEQSTQQQTRAALIRLFEDTFVRSLAVSAPAGTDFQPTLIVDMRNGQFVAAVASIDTNQQFKRTARPVSVEEGEQVTPTQEQTTLSAYRKKSSKTWRACSIARANEVSNQPDNQVALNIFTRALECPAEQQLDQFISMYFPFLKMFKESKADYTAIAILLDEQAHIELTARALQALSERLGDPRWQSAQLLYINPTYDLRGFAFLNEPAQGLQNHYRFLLMSDSEHAIDVSYTAGFLRYTTVNQIDDLGNYAKIGVIGMSEASFPFDPRVLRFEDVQSFQASAVLNYVMWMPMLLQRIPALHKYGFEVQKTLRHVQAQNTVLSALVKRLQSVLIHAEEVLRSNI